jgi:fumarate hydratase class I
MEGPSMADDLFPLSEDSTEYRKISGDYISVDSF